MNRDNDASELELAIREQYGSLAGQEFYRLVMGDGGADTHYGIYRDSAGSMGDATLRATKHLIGALRSEIGSGLVNRIVDLGSGRGGAAHRLAQSFGADMMCVDLSDENHSANLSDAEDLTIAAKIRTWTGSYENLPKDWSGKFDIAWAQESLCHAKSLRRVASEAFRVLREGGLMVFSDVTLGALESHSGATAFQSVNAIIRLRTLDEIRDTMTNVGFEWLWCEDWTAELGENFRRMRQQLENHRSELISAGVPRKRLDSFHQSLLCREKWKTGEGMGWYAGLLRKPKNPTATSYSHESLRDSLRCSTASRDATLEAQVSISDEMKSAGPVPQSFLALRPCVSPALRCISSGTPKQRRKRNKK